MKIILSNTSFLAAVFSAFSSAALVPSTNSPLTVSFDMRNRYSYTTAEAGSLKIMASLIRASEDGGENGTCEERLDRPEPFGVAESVFLALTLGLLIMVMIVGNILVITAILLERELQRAQYYLVLSLAVADLTVGVVVSPLAALYDINRQWHLGVPMCDFWIVSDVLACTSSILHLLAIALDRYWSITDVSYVQKRTPRRIGIMLLIVWIVSFCVSVAPILGWKDSQFTCRVEVRKECLISQAIGYQIFSTTTAFYGPLVLICILYWKIYKAAKRRIQMQVKRRSNTVAQLRAKILALQQNPDGGDRRRSTFRKPKPIEKAVATARENGGTQSRSGALVQIRVTRSSSNEPTAAGLDPDSQDARNGYLAIRTGVDESVLSSCYSINDDDSSYCEDVSTSVAFAVDYTASAGLPYQGGVSVPCTAIVAPAPASAMERRNGTNSPNMDSGGLANEDSDSPVDGAESPTPSPLLFKEKRDSLTITRARAQSLSSPRASLAVKGARGSRHSTVSQSECTSISCSPGATAAQSATRAAAIVAASVTAGGQKRKRPRTKKELVESSRERRAGRTLAIITGIFVVCWVPFFVLALMRPLCGGPKSCPVPEPLDSIFLWLGYVNSAVNPIIYTIFSPDFRMAFKRTLQRFCYFRRMF